MAQCCSAALSLSCPPRLPAVSHLSCTRHFTYSNIRAADDKQLVQISGIAWVFSPPFAHGRRLYSPWRSPHSLSELSADLDKKTACSVRWMCHYSHRSGGGGTVCTTSQHAFCRQGVSTLPATGFRSSYLKLKDGACCMKTGCLGSTPQKGENSPSSDIFG